MSMKGIETRHTRSCRSRSPAGKCDCDPSYRASVWDGKAGESIRATFTDPTAAIGWRRDARAALARGRTPAAHETGSLRSVYTEWHRLALKGVVRTSGGEQYKRGALRAYDQAMRIRVLPVHGDDPIGEISRVEWQLLVDELLDADWAPATVHTTIAAASAVYRHLVKRGKLPHNPTIQLEMPAAKGRRDRVAPPIEAFALIEALPVTEQALWATAMYTGMRRGELMALPVNLIDLDEGTISVYWGWDMEVGRIETKGRNRRTVPLPQELRAPLSAHLLRTGRRGNDLAFGSAVGTPFATSTVKARSIKAWKAAKLKRITMHECRHTYASLMIASGVNVKTLSTYMGHSSISTTLDLYGHLFPGNEAEAAKLLDDYLGRARKAADG